MDREIIIYCDNHMKHMNTHYVDKTKKSVYVTADDTYH